MNINNRKRKYGIENILKGFDSGFTIVETTIALSLLAIGILAMTSLQLSSTRSTTTTETLTQNAFHGFDQFEKLIASDYSAVNDGSVTDGIYTVSWTVSPADVPIPNTKAITITMYANRGGSNEKGRMSFVYYKAERF